MSFRHALVFALIGALIPIYAHLMHELIWVQRERLVSEHDSLE